ncbi:hypothetical protein, partial [Dickeya dadantii]|uniref:hypothetical protein n=1 Tax=Dickeya dadantii TaxID=204038 RepID=UPI001C37B248
LARKGEPVRVHNLAISQWSRRGGVEPLLVGRAMMLQRNNRRYHARNFPLLWHKFICNKTTWLFVNSLNNKDAAG